MRSLLQQLEDNYDEVKRKYEWLETEIEDKKREIANLRRDKSKLEKTQVPFDIFYLPNARKWELLIDNWEQITLEDVEGITKLKSP